MRHPQLGTGLVLAILLLPAVTQAQLPAAGNERAGWLLNRAAWSTTSLTGEVPDPGASDGSFTETEGDVYSQRRASGKAGWPILMSAILPGAGEAYLGYKRGYFMMALDIAAWMGVKYYNDSGHEKRDAYYAFAEAHWSEEKLGAAFWTGAGDANPHYEEIAGLGLEYFQVSDSEFGYTELPLWVSREEDQREYFENLGKWDQFVFGWDDFQDPHQLFNDLPVGDIANLTLAGVSNNRELYRSMRQDSNSDFEKRDRLLYLNIGLRVFSIFQVAYLQGLLGGGPKQNIQVAGHPVALIAESHGWTGTRLGFNVSY